MPKNPSPRWRNNRAVALDDMSSTLSGTTTLVYTTAASGQVQVTGNMLALDPGGASRFVNLPTEAAVVASGVVGSAGVPLYVYNSADANGEDLILRGNSGSKVVCRVGRGQMAMCWSNGTAWFGSVIGAEATDGRDSAGRWGDIEDFNKAAGGTLPTPWGTQDTSAGGTPTLDYSNDASGGQYVLKLDTTNEVENVTLYWADNRTIDITKDPVVEFRLKIEPDVTGAGGQFAAGDKLTVGLASDRNADPDAVATNLWFLFGGAADHTIRIEGDDGTTDTDDTSAGISWVDDTFTVLRIDASDLSAVKFYVDGVLVATTIAVAVATGNVQPWIQLQKAAAANKDHRVTVDYVAWSAGR